VNIPKKLSDESQEIKQYRAPLAKIREELAQVKLANETLQTEKADLERRLYDATRIKFNTWLL